MTCFVDTSGWIAFFRETDEFHSAVSTFLKKHSPKLLTSNIVLHETLAHLHARGSKDLAYQSGKWLLNQMLVQMLIVTKEQEEKTFELFESVSAKVSFVDCNNVIVMKDYSVKFILACDQDFQKMGLTVVP